MNRWTCLKIQQQTLTHAPTRVHVEELEAEPAHVHVARGVDDLEAARGSRGAREGLGVGAFLGVDERAVEEQLLGQVHAVRG